MQLSKRGHRDAQSSISFYTETDTVLSEIMLDNREIYKKSLRVLARYHLLFHVMIVFACFNQKRRNR